MRFFSNDTATTEIYTLSLHDALPIFPTLTARENVEVPLYVGKHEGSPSERAKEVLSLVGLEHRLDHRPNQLRSEEHTSELQSRRDLVCRLLLEKKKQKNRRQQFVTYN